MTGEQEVGKQEVVEAVAQSWAKETSEIPEQWVEENPAMGHCDVSSFVAWEHLGGQLVLGEVHRNGEFQEHHYWNRIEGVDLDLTRSQFRNGEVITEKDVLEEAYLRENQDAMRPDLLARISAFRQQVNNHLNAHNSVRAD